MELINQHTKSIMEECKVRARDAGLSFQDETLEYLVTNRDMIELSPKVMIPTLYDYWVNDVEVLKGIGKYKVYPHNPYETVINSRPAISFYNDNNPDWLNIMIFYHVLGHIDFFQNNSLFEKTWNDDFVGQALADKRLIANLRIEHGRWVDYVIEFARSINNICGYFDILAKHNFPKDKNPNSKLSYYFDIFLQEEVKLPQHEIFSQIDKYNKLTLENSEVGESIFFSEVKRKHPEFNSHYEKYLETKEDPAVDLIEFLIEESPFLQKNENEWMKSVLNIIRNTALYFEPQIRTKTINEGWASYWHDKLFRVDDRISGHEVAYANINAGVTSIHKVGLNPYAIGLRLIQYIEELADKGKMNYSFQKQNGIEFRENYNQKTGKGQETIFKLRQYFSDFTLFNTFVDQEFVDMHQLFVVGQRPNQQRGTIEYFIKSKKAEDYKQMLIDSLYHPPKVYVAENKTTDDNLYLYHQFEGKQLIKDFIPETLLGIEYLWGGQVQLETTELLAKGMDKNGKKVLEQRKVLYTMKDKKVTKKNL